MTATNHIHSLAGIEILEREKCRIERKIGKLTSRLATIRKSGYWTLEQEIRSIDKQLTRGLTRLNRINSTLSNIYDGQENEQ